MQQVQLKQLARRFVGQTHLSAELERRIRTMARRWRYTEADLSDALERARADPVRWLMAVDLDERKFGQGEAWPLQ